VVQQMRSQGHPHLQARVETSGMCHRPLTKREEEEEEGEEREAGGGWEEEEGEEDSPLLLLPLSSSSSSSSLSSPLHRPYILMFSLTHF